jgi:O-antigen/teichoic acid export membrane protein
MLVITIALPLALQAHRLILSHVTDINTVASYALALQIYLAGWSVITVSGLALWPVFARLRKEGGAESGRNLRIAVLVFAAAGAVSGLAMYSLGPTVAGLLGGSAVTVSYPLSLAFGLLLLVQAIQLPVGMYLTSERGLRVQATCVCFMVVLSTLLSIFLAGIWGARGPVYGSLVAVVLCQLLPGAAWTLRELRHGGEAPTTRAAEDELGRDVRLH